MDDEIKEIKNKLSKIQAILQKHQNKFEKQEEDIDLISGKAKLQAPKSKSKNLYFLTGNKNEIIKMDIETF